MMCKHNQCADHIFKCIFLNENVWIFIKMLMQFVPTDSIDNIPSLVRMVAWHQPGKKSLSEPMTAYLTAAYMCHLASMSY